MAGLRRLSLVLFTLLALFSARPAAAQTTTFNAGSLIIPMDTTYQDDGMLSAFGLLDQLLRAGVTVNWIITPDKTVVDTATGTFTSDMTASATDFTTGDVITSYAYRGGPFVVDVSFAAQASPIITAWNQSTVNSMNHVSTTTVHVASASFQAPVSRVMTAAPRIAVFDDMNQQIAFSYLGAAGMTDEDGTLFSMNYAGPDLLTDTEVIGDPSSPNDGALFDANGLPVFCEIMTMHWNVGSTDIPGVVAEMNSFLKFPVHVNAECQAVNAIEGQGGGQTTGAADFVTTDGFQWPAPMQPSSVQFSNSALPFAQLDGAFGTTGGSEPAYALATGSTYYNKDIVMIRGAGVDYGVQDIWMTGYAHGACDIQEGSCNGVGKISYLGGHQYQNKTPISTNPQTQGARLFLNSLFEAGCVTSEGQPLVSLTKSAPSAVGDNQLTFTLSYSNQARGPAINFVLTDPIPAGSTFVSATGGGTYSSSTGDVTWSGVDLGFEANESVSFTVTLPAMGTYTNQASATYRVGNSTFSLQSNQTSTIYGQCGSDGDCTSPLVCDTTTSQCVQCTQSEPQSCTSAGSGVCLSNDTCGCTVASDCPSGDSCTGGACVPPPPPPDAGASSTSTSASSATTTSTGVGSTGESGSSGSGGSTGATSGASTGATSGASTGASSGASTASGGGSSGGSGTGGGTSGSAATTGGGGSGSAATTGGGGGGGSGSGGASSTGSAPGGSASAPGGGTSGIAASNGGGTSGSAAGSPDGGASGGGSAEADGGLAAAGPAQDGGCGCTTQGTPAPKRAGLGLAGMALLLAAARRRRRV